MCPRTKRCICLYFLRSRSVWRGTKGIACSLACSFLEFMVLVGCLRACGSNTQANQCGIPRVRWHDLALSAGQCATAGLLARGCRGGTGFCDAPLLCSCLLLLITYFRAHRGVIRRPLSSPLMREYLRRWLMAKPRRLRIHVVSKGAAKLIKVIFV